MAERSLPDVRQHQDIVFPWRIHADYRSAVEIPRLARDDDTKGWLSPRPSGIALLYCGEAATTTLNLKP